MKDFRPRFTKEELEYLLGCVLSGEKQQLFMGYELDRLNTKLAIEKRKMLEYGLREHNDTDTSIIKNIEALEKEVRIVSFWLSQNEHNISNIMVCRLESIMAGGNRHRDSFHFEAIKKDNKAVELTTT